MFYLKDPVTGWTIGWRHCAILFYRPERRLSISVGIPRLWSRNFRLWGPRKLSWER